METIDINVVGSPNVARMAIEKSIKLVIGISTNKTSPPVRNTYGLTKALMVRLLSSGDAERLTEDEIRSLINHPPIEEL